MDVTQSEVTAIWDKLDRFADEAWHEVTELTRLSFARARIVKNGDLERSLEISIERVN